MISGVLIGNNVTPNQEAVTDCFYDGRFGADLFLVLKLAASNLYRQNRSLFSFPGRKFDLNVMELYNQLRGAKLVICVYHCEINWDF